MSKRPTTTSTYQLVKPNQAAENLDKHLLSSWQKYNATIPCLFMTTILSTIALIALERKWVITGSFYLLVTGNRATAAVVVQLVSNILGLAHVYVLTNIIALTTNQYIQTHSRPLKALVYWSSLRGAGINWSLPWRYLLPVFLFLGSSKISSILWAGTITPVVTVLLNVRASIEVAQYSNSTQYYWLQGWGYGPNDTFAPAVQNINGLFSYVPVRDRQGFLLNDASVASSRNGSAVTHRKNDNTGFAYVGRSYGVGSSVGIIDGILHDAQATPQFSYYEHGYKAEITNCLFNSTPAMDLLQVYSAAADSPLPDMYFAQGLPPCGGGTCNGGYEGFVVLGFGTSSIVVAKFGNAGEYKRIVPAGSTAWLGIIAGSSYVELNGMQCDVALRPTKFSVDVDVRGRNIFASPTNEEAQDIDPSGWIAYESCNTILLTSMIQTNLYSSLYGNALLSNVNNVLAQPTQETRDEKILRGISEALESMIDNTLMAYASAQLVIAHDTRSTPAMVPTMNALQIGQKPYIYSVFVYNLAVIATFVFVATTTKGWQRLINFDYLNLQDLMLSTSHGGWSLGDSAKAIAGQYPTKKRAQVIGMLRVKLEADEKFPAMKHMWT